MVVESVYTQYNRAECLLAAAAMFLQLLADLACKPTI